MKEHDYAYYGCAPRMFLLNSEADDVVGGKFRLQCGAGGAYPASPAWPDCKPSRCDTPPDPAGTGFRLLTQGPVLVGGDAK